MPSIQGRRAFTIDRKRVLFRSARALILAVLLGQLEEAPQRVRALATTYTAFLDHAFDPRTSRFHNRSEARPVPICPRADLGGVTRPIGRSPAACAGAGHNLHRFPGPCLRSKNVALSQFHECGPPLA